MTTRQRPVLTLLALFAAAFGAGCAASDAAGDASTEAEVVAEAENDPEPATDREAGGTAGTEQSPTGASEPTVEPRHEVRRARGTAGTALPQ